MSAETLPRHLRLDQAYVDGEFDRIVERMSARHALEEPTQPLTFTPRSNIVLPRPRQPIDDLPPTPLDPKDTTKEARKPGRHRAPRASLIEWLGGRAARTTTITMLAAGIALQGAGTLIEDSLERQTAYNLTLEEPAIVFPEVTEPVEKPSLPTQPKPLPKAAPTQQHTAPKPTAPPTAKPAPTVPAKKPAPQHTKATVTTAKKPAIASADHWPAAGTNCNYLPKHQHKASETSAAQAKAIFKKMVVACFGSKEWPAAEQLWQHESNFRPMARNPHGGACGVVQALPCSKLLRASGSSSLKNTTVEKQARWGVRYVKSAYGTPTRAWRHWRARVRINGRDVGNWY